MLLQTENRLFDIAREIIKKEKKKKALQIIGFV